MLSLLLAQPPEIIVSILQWLSVRDLLSLRLSTRRFHTLVHDHEQCLCDRFGTFARRCSGTDSPTTKPTHKDLTTYIHLHDTHDRISVIAQILANQITPHVTPITPIEKIALEAARNTKTILLRQALVPVLFSLNHFLEALREVVVDGEAALATWNDELYMSAVDLFMLDQQHILQQYTAKDIRNMSIVWVIFLGVCKARRLGLSTRSAKYPLATVKRILIHRGLTAFAEVLAPGIDDARRRELLDRACGQLDHRKRSVTARLEDPLTTIHHLDLKHLSATEPAVQRSYKVVNKFIDRQDILLKAAFAVLQRLGKVDSHTGWLDSNAWILKKTRIRGESESLYMLTGWTAP